MHDAMCPVCGKSQSIIFAKASDLEYFTTDKIYTYLQCYSCKLVYLESPPVDELNVIYPENYYSYSVSDGISYPEKIKRWLDSRLFQRLLRQIPGEKLRVLDIGGGSGWMLSLLREISRRKVETHELDIDERARQKAETAGHKFHCKRIEEFKSSLSFDLIFALNIIEHVVDPIKVLEIAKQMLSPDGLILIKTPNIDTMDCRLFQHRNWGGFHCPRHWVLFTMDGLVELARRCGLCVVEASYTQGGPQWAASIMAALWSCGLVTVTKETPITEHPLTKLLQVLGAAFDFCRLPFSKTAQMIIVLKSARPID